MLNVNPIFIILHVCIKAYNLYYDEQKRIYSPVVTLLDSTVHLPSNDPFVIQKLIIVKY